MISFSYLCIQNLFALYLYIFMDILVSLCISMFILHCLFCEKRVYILKVKWENNPFEKESLHIKLLRKLIYILVTCFNGSKKKHDMDVSCDTYVSDLLNLLEP